MMNNPLSHNRAYPFIQNNKKIIVVMNVLGYSRSLLSRLLQPMLVMQVN